MELFAKLFGSLMVFVYHCFDGIVIPGYLSALRRPEQVVHFFRQVAGLQIVDKEVLSRRTGAYQDWVEAFARNHDTPIEGPRKVCARKTTLTVGCVRWCGPRYGVYFTFKSMEQGPHVSLQGAEVSDPRPPLPYPGAPQGPGVPL